MQKELKSLWDTCVTFHGHGCGGQGREEDSFHRFKRMVSRCKNRVFRATVPYPDYGSAYHYYGAASFSVG